MKHIAFVFTYLMPFILLGLAQAADSTWDAGVTTGSFDDDSNWTNNAPGATSGTTSPDTATFDVTADTIVTVDAFRNVLNVAADSANATSLTFNSGAFQLSDGGSITRTGGGSETSSSVFNSDIVLNGDATFTSSTDGSLSFGLAGGSSISGTAAAASTQTLLLNGNSSNTNNEIASLLSDGANGGQLAINKNGGSIWVFSNPLNAYTGGTVIGATGSFNGTFGQVRAAASGALGTGMVTIRGNNLHTGGLRLDGADAPGGGITLANPIQNENFRSDGADRAHIENLSGNNELSGQISINGSQNPSQNDRRSMYIKSSADTLLISGAVNPAQSSGSVRNFYLDADGGDITVSGVIGTGGRSIQLFNVGPDTLTLSGANTYTGATFLNAGTTLVNNIAGSGTGTNTVTVSNAGTVLGGDGAIGGDTTMETGTILAPGASEGSTGSLDFDAALDISGLADGTEGLLFELAGIGGSDTVTLSSGVLTIGSGLLDLDDFDFAALDGFDAGTYTLFDTTQTIVGSLGSNLTGSLEGQPIALSLANLDQDIIVTVVPEPATFALIFGGIAVVISALRRRQRS